MLHPSRRFIGLFLVAALGAGCTGGDAEDGVTTVTFWHSFVSSSRPAVDELIAAFEAEHPHLRIRAQYIPTGDGLIHKLVSAVQSRTAPDMSWVHADFLGPLVQADALYPMSTFLRGPDSLASGVLEDIIPGALDAARWQDTLYAMPMEATLLALVYNKDHFREAGLDPDRPPTDWAEMRSMVRTLSYDRDGDGRWERLGFYVPSYPASGPLNIWMVLQWLPTLWQAGGVEIDAGQTRVLFNSSAGVDALTYWRDLYTDMGRPAFSQSHDVSFASGFVSMIMDGPWDLPRFRELKEFEWAIAPLPAGPVQAATYLGGEHIAIFKQSAHPEEAWTFVKWVLRPDVQARFSIASGYLPVRRATLELPEYQLALENDPALKAFVDLIPMARARRPIDYHHVEMNRYLAEAIEQTLVGGRNPVDALNDAAERANRLLAESIPQ
jgi:ABC-type glycerol-3-phosphate transport system substrate-binding protein